jgi:hypothetical protein
MKYTDREIYLMDELIRIQYESDRSSKSISDNEIAKGLGISKPIFDITMLRVVTYIKDNEPKLCNIKKYGLERYVLFGFSNSAMAIFAHEGGFKGHFLRLNNHSLKTQPKRAAIVRIAHSIISFVVSIVAKVFTKKIGL